MTITMNEDIAGRLDEVARIMAEHGANRVLDGVIEVILLIAWLFIRWIRAKTTCSLLAVGVGWLVLTVLFEIGLGRLAMGLTWERIFSGCDLSKGGMMSLGVVCLTFAPLLAARLRGLRSVWIDNAPARPPAASSAEGLGSAVVIGSCLAANEIPLGWIPIVCFLVASLLVWRRLDQYLADARARAARGSVVVQTRCGPMQSEEAGQGVPLLMIHGAAGGHDQGMAVGRSLAPPGVRRIAVSRFGYPSTPTFGAPCPVTLFTLGVLLMSDGRHTKRLFVIPLLWAVLGSIAAFRLGMKEDLGLLAAAGLSIWFAFRRGKPIGPVPEPGQEMLRGRPRQGGRLPPVRRWVVDE
jgi:hypothetical protein